MNTTTLMVPNLTTALSGPLHQLEALLLEKQAQIEGWFRDQWNLAPAPFYASVDLRNAGFKLAPVDTNLFPAGFNNLNPAFHPLCIQALQNALERVCPYARQIVIIPENHTRNLFYLENLETIRQLIAQAGFNVRVGSLLPEITEPKPIELPSGRTLLLEPLRRDGHELFVGGIDNEIRPCAILLNNDLSSGRPELLEDLDQQIVPPLGLGWAERLKSEHFGFYDGVAKEFATELGIDPWLVAPEFEHCGRIDFMNREGEECLAEAVGKVLERVSQKYAEYGIEREPFVVVKSDAGTYGMGIMTARSVEDVRGMNRKQRTKMSAGKEGSGVSKVIIQEGVYTEETWEGAVAEPVVYMVDHFVVGGFYRVHENKAQDENLNSPGMRFQPLAFAEPGNNPDSSQAPDASPNRFYAYGVIARLALLAASREIQADIAERETAVATGA